MMHSWRRALLGLICCVFLATPALAQSDAANKGDPAAGRIKFNSCVGCHGIPNYHWAYPHYNVPKIGGQHYQYLVKALTEYATGKREHTTMHAQAASLSKQDIKDIAAFLSQPKS